MAARYRTTGEAIRSAAVEKTQRGRRPPADPTDSQLAQVSDALLAVYRQHRLPWSKSASCRLIEGWILLCELRCMPSRDEETPVPYGRPSTPPVDTRELEDDLARVAEEALDRRVVARLGQSRPSEAVRIEAFLLDRPQASMEPDAAEKSERPVVPVEPAGTRGENQPGLEGLTFGPLPGPGDSDGGNG